MWWAAAIQGGLQLFGAIGQQSAAGDARRIANLNADAQTAENTEEARRMRREGEQRVGYAKAVAGASGFSIQPGTGQQTYINEMVAENRRQQTFQHEAGARKTKILRKGGDLAYRHGQAAAVGSLASAAGSFGTMWSSPDAPWT